jgi:DNA-binding response OmpR family regulator
VKRNPGRLRVPRPPSPATDQANVTGSASVAKSDYVLIVDGTAEFTNLLESELASAGLETHRFPDAKSAVETSPRAVVIDLRFAGLPGADVIARLRKDSAPHVSIVMLEARSR